MNTNFQEFRMGRFRVSAFAFVAFISCVFSTSAHELRPAYLELREELAGHFSVLWKTPMRGEYRLSLAPGFSGQTENVTPVVTRQLNNAAVQTWRLKAVEPLPGQTVRIAGLEGTMTDALVRFEFLDGTTWVKRLTPGEPAATIPARQSGWSVAVEYSKLGVEHILTGIDHLLFVLALIIITGATGKWSDGVMEQWKTPSVRTPNLLRANTPLRRLVLTVTAFTVSHSLTLTAATLGWVHMPQAPVEAIIALSIVFVAAEIVQGYRGREGVAARAPWVVAFSFGLLHGLGFAGGLSEAGLPTGHIPTALLFFSVGVETGHLLFVGAVLALLAIKLPMPRWARLVPPYAIGSVAMFWVIQRVAAF